jgi:PEP-CTERM motif-containing protein
MYSVTRLLTAIAGLGLAVGIAQTSQAAVLLSDNFDSDSPVSVLNFDAFINWTVDSGTVDYIRSGDSFGIVCVGGIGGCVDSDGTSNDAGRLVSRETFSLPAFTPFAFSVEVSGNQRPGFSPADALTVGIVDATTLALIVSSTCTRLSSDPYSTCGITVLTGWPSALTFRAFIEGAGADNVGAVFDNFVLTAEIAQASEPVTLALFGIALVGLGFRRRKSALN